MFNHREGNTYPKKRHKENGNCIIGQYEKKGDEILHNY